MMLALQLSIVGHKTDIRKKDIKESGKSQSSNIFKGNYADLSINEVFVYDLLKIEREREDSWTIVYLSNIELNSF